MTVVVTGAAGHVGANLVHALLAQGRPVRVLVHRRREIFQGLPVEIVPGDVRDPVSLCRAFAGAEVVYHLAGHISILASEWPLLEQVNVLGTRNVVEACLVCGVRRLIHCSSIHALEQEPLDAPLDENRPLALAARHAPYDRSKAAGELEVQRGLARGLDAVILNPTAIIGPLDYGPSHLGTTLLALAQGRMPILVEGGFDWVDVRDVVAGALAAEERGAKGARYILSGQWASIRALAEEVASLSHAPAPWLYLPLWLAQLGAPLATAWDQLRGRRPLFTSVSIRTLRSNRHISHERASRELGYAPRPLRTTLEDTLNWFRATGRLSHPIAAATAEVP